MIDIPKDIREYITRDLVFLVGGSCVVASFLYYFNQLPDEKTPFVFNLLAAGVAYIVGYALQDGFSVVHFVTTANIKDPWCLKRGLYKLFTRREWKDAADLVEQDWRLKGKALLAKFDESDYYRMAYQRAITLLMVGATVAPCALVSALLLCLRGIRSHEPYDFALLAAAAVAGIILWVLNWIKALQVTQTVAEAIRDFKAADQAT